MSCGTCTLCCKTLAVDALQKPRDSWCSHCSIGHGCTIYVDRPADCVEFSCGWLQAEQRGDSWGPDFRPDRCKVIVGAKGDVLWLFTDRVGAEEKFRPMADRLRKRGMAVMVMHGNKSWRM